MTSTSTKYDQAVGSRFHIYNSLFLNLPFRNVLRTGTLLPLLQQYCVDGFRSGLSANDIVKQFFTEMVPQANRVEQFDLLFSFIHYVERQDAAFEQINDLHGKGTVSALLLQAKFENRVEELKGRLATFGLRVVLTAHPTQFYPGFVLGILNDLEQSIRSADIPQINQLLQQLGKTAFINKTKPTPLDEAVSLTWYLEHVFYQAIPQIILDLCEGLQIPTNEWTNDRLVTVGFWPGGDRDGNPYVTSSITIKVAAHLKESILKCYYRDIRLLRRRLNFTCIDSLIFDIDS
jgi:phosphoenolpyruvate carboxylase